MPKTNNMGTAECILMTLCTGEFYKNFLIVCYSPGPQSPTDIYFTFSCSDLNIVWIYQNHHSREVTAMEYEGGLGKGFSLQDCRHHDMVVITPLAGLASFVFLGFICWHCVRHVKYRCWMILDCEFWRRWKETVIVIVY